VSAEEQRWQPLVASLEKSPHDARQYQAIRLENGMKVLLVSDPKAPFSMTTVALPVGSLHDPYQQAGLVHYLEHLLFLGSEHYPEGIEIQNHNAGTGSDRTVFMASTQHPWLAVTLERLADALTHPKFDSQLADKERHSVHQEACGHRTEDSWRIFQINKETLNPRHPFARFSTGNLETLADKLNNSLLQTVQHFHKYYYSANIMVAVIYSNQPLAALAHLAAESYGRIPNHKTVVKSITTPLATIKEQGVAIHYVPAKVYNALQVDFVITPDQQDSLHSKTNFYLDSLITARGEGTLAEWLQQQGLANNISVSYHAKMAGNAGLFSIHIDPTEAGVAQQDLILAALFRYLDLIKMQGVQRRYFDQMAQQLVMNSHYSAAQRNLNYVASLTNNLLEYPIEQVLIANNQVDSYRPSFIRWRLSKMIPQQARIWFISPQEAHDKSAYFLEAPYQIKPLSRQQIAEWQRLGKELTFKLPTINPYLPTDFSLMPVKRVRPRTPQLVLQAAGVRAWLLPSHHFKEQPMVDITLALRNPNAFSTPRDQVLFVLLDRLMDLQTRSLTAQASDAGVYLSAFEDEGVIIKAQGFRQQLPHLVLQFVKACQHITVGETQLAEVKQRLIQQWDSRLKQAPDEQANRTISEINWINYGSLDQRRTLLAEIGLKEVLSYRDRLLKQATLDILAIGDLSAAQLRDLAQTVQKELTIRKQPHSDNLVIVIDRPTHALFNKSVTVEGHALAALYIPSGYDKFSSQANAYLLSNLLGTWFFDQLRTQEQLGYIVSVGTSYVGGKTGLQFTVQSNGHTPAQLYQRYQAFYQQAWQQLQKLKEPREFAHYQRGLLKQLQHEPSSLGDEAAPWVKDFLNERLSFDSQAQLIARVKALTAEEVLQFYQQAVLEPTGLALLSQAQGLTASSKALPTAQGFAAPAGWRVYSTANELQQQLLTQGKTPKPTPVQR
jgi:protease-3